MPENKHFPTTTPDWQASVRRRTRFYTLAAVLLAVLFGVLTYSFFSRQDPSAGGPVAAAVFSQGEIPVGETLTGDHLITKRVAEEALPAAYFQGEEVLVGRKTLYPLAAGEVITPHKLAGGQGGPIAQRCPAERWCVMVPKSWFIARPPEMTAGDLLAIGAAHPEQGRDNLGFIADDVQVVAIDHTPETPSYIFALEDQEALQLLYARTKGFQLIVLLQPAGG